MWSRFLALLAALALCAPLVRAQVLQTILEQDYGPASDKTSLRVFRLFDQVPPSGYYPVRVSIHNDSQLERTWDFSFVSTDERFGDVGNQLTSSFTITCPAEKTLEQDLLVPLVTAFHELHASATLNITATPPAPFPVMRNSVSSYYDPSWPSLLISNALWIPNQGLLQAAVEDRLTGASGGYSSSSGVEFGAAFDPGQMPDDWRAYLGFDGCLLTEEDWKALDSGSRNALLKWNRLGGLLLIYSPNPTTTLDTLGIDATPSAGPDRAVRGWGLAALHPLPRDRSLDAEDTVDIVADTLLPLTRSHRLDVLRNDFQGTWPLQAELGSSAANITFFVLILLAFGVLVGPVNLFVFAPAGQRHRLFITTPIISLAASALLVVLILFLDGMGARGLRVVLMEMGPDNSAYLSQEQVVRTGVLLRTSFSTDQPGFLSPVQLGESRWTRVTDRNDGGKGRYILNLQENGLRASGDWFKSRSEHGHLFETILPTRSGISLVRESPTPVVTSSFDFALETLFYLAPDGQVWLGENILQGRNTSLTLATREQLDAWFTNSRSHFTSRNRKRLSLALDRTGSFLASTTDAPGVDTLKSTNWIDTRTVLTGPVQAP